MKKNTYPFLITKNNAQEMIDYYQSIFSDFEVISIAKYNDIPMNDSDKIVNAQIRINNMDLMLMDMPEEHFVEYNHSFSIMINLDTDEEFYNVFNKLSIDGVIMMGPEPVADLKLVTWFTDKFNITWQLTC